jgi:hypothetical protein
MVKVGSVFLRIGFGSFGLRKGAISIHIIGLAVCGVLLVSVIDAQAGHR